MLLPDAELPWVREIELPAVLPEPLLWLLFLATGLVVVPLLPFLTVLLPCERETELPVVTLRLACASWLRVLPELREVVVVVLVAS